MSDYHQVLRAGSMKLETSEKLPFTFFLKSVLAGIYLGIAMLLSMGLAGTFYLTAPPFANIAFAIFFGLTFILIIFLNGELFTGNCLTTMFPFLSRKYKLKILLKNWLLSLTGNVVGVITFMYLIFIANAMNPNSLKYLSYVVHNKMMQDNSTLFFNSILCNFIVCVATYVGLKFKSEIAKTVVILLVISTFVISGLNHSIANVGLLTISYLTQSAEVSTIMAITKIVISIVGNIIGGSILYAIPLFWVTKKTEIQVTINE